MGLYLDTSSKSNLAVYTYESIPKELIEEITIKDIWNIWRFILYLIINDFWKDGPMMEWVDMRDLKSLGQEWPCGFESRSGY